MYNTSFIQAEIRAISELRVRLVEAISFANSSKAVQILLIFFLKFVFHVFYAVFSWRYIC